MTQTQTPAQIPPDPDKAAARRALLERIVSNLKKGRAQRLARLNNPPWNAEEYEKALPFAERVKKKEISQYRACMELVPLLKDRSFEAIRKKLKNWVNYGRWC